MALFRTDASSSGSSSKVASVSPGRQGRTSVPLGIDPNRSSAEAPVDPALPLLPIPLGEDPHAGIQDPEQRSTHPDQERREEEAALAHLKLAVLVDDPSLRVPHGPEQPPHSQAQEIVGTVGQLPHGPSISGKQDHRLSLDHRLPVSCRIRSVSEVRAQGKRTTQTHFRNVRTYPKGWSSIRRLDVRAVSLRS